MSWHRVTEKTPCPVCKKPDWCMIGDDGAALCMRITSPKQLSNGGWLHKAAGEITLPPIPPPRPPAPKRSPVEVRFIHERMRNNTSMVDIVRLAEALNVDDQALIRLGAAIAPWPDVYAFPMRNAFGDMTGIRFRALDGRKWSLKGGAEGLFYEPRPPGTTPVALITEGPTDTAAALALGFYAIGRPSCTGAVEILKTFCRRMQIRELIIVMDNDAPKRYPDGTIRQPGKDGALQMAKAIGRPMQFIMPAAKDLRAWCADGLTREMFDFILKNKPKVQP